MSLVSHGIQKERSEYRVHVGFGSKKVYAFKQEDAIRAIDKHQPREVSVYVDGRQTATGYIISPFLIDGVKELKLGTEFGVKESDSTSKKGQAAVDVVKLMVKKGKFLGLNVKKVEEVTDLELQYAGFDLFLHLDDGSKVGVEVKCDWRCGHGGTGNLFLQTAERNYSRQY